jgi:TonB-linked SusC/RagA family outer membrane protein
LNYVKKIGDHKLTGLLGVEYRSDTQEYVYSAVSSFPTPQFFTANSASTNLGFGGLWTGFKRASAFGKLDYNFKSKYFASFVNRYDGSSRFGTEKYGWFPAASVAWAVNEEAFLKDNEYISALKARLSYGVTGNDAIGNFSSLNLFGAGNNYNDLPGFGPSQLGTAALRWEKTTSYNAGLDLSFLDGRITSTVEYFVKNTSDLLLNRPLPGVSGFTAITDNIGKLQNKGWEFEVSSTNLDMENGFVWTTSFNFSKINNYVKKLNGDDQVLPGNQSVRVGEPLTTSFNYQYIGVNPATGRPMWYDKNNNITYRPVIADARVVGDGFAEMFGGLTNTLSYKGVELSFTFQYEFGRMAYNDQNAFLMENIARFNGLKDYYDRRWQKPGDITDVPRVLNTTSEVLGSSNLTGTRTYQDASYIRLKTTSLSYTLPKEMLSKVKLTNVRVYVQALNLLTFTKWEGYDPEFVALSTTAGNAGVIPQSRKYTFGVQIGF